MKLIRVVSMGGEWMNNGKNHYERWLICFSDFDEAVFEVRCESMLSVAQQFVSTGSAVHEPLEFDSVDICGGISTARVKCLNIRG